MSLEHKVGEEASKDSESQKGNRSIKYGRLIAGVGAISFGFVSITAGLYMGMESLIQFGLHPSVLSASGVVISGGVVYFGNRAVSAGTYLVLESRDNASDE